MKVNICEEFISIDGEVNGFFGQGQWSYFIRFAGCNMRCSYCDTKYSWDKGRETDIKDIVNRVVSSGLKKVTVTGGEPFFQERKLEQLLLDLRERTFPSSIYVTIETNGSCKLNHLWITSSNWVRIIMDWKEGVLDEIKYENLQILTKGKDWIKFVIDSKEGYERAKIEVSNISFRPIAFSLCRPNVSEIDLYNWMKEDKLWNIHLNTQLHKLIGVS